MPGINWWSMRHTLVMLAALAAPAFAHDDTRIPMPMDIAPHHTHFIAGPHHYDIQPEQYEQRHFGTHWISFGQHNYDMSNDPYVREQYDHTNAPRRYRGMGLGEHERYSMMRRDLRQIDDHAEEPWVLSRINRRGLDYEMSPEEEHDEMHRRAVGFPRPSWYAIYKKQKRVVRE